jgi:choline dehydrogenase-like flavoprotein
LNSSNPFDPPLINPNYLAHQFDTFTVVAAMRDAFGFLNSSQFAGLVGQPTLGLALNNTDDQLLSYARANGETLNHGVGTARISPFGANWGVVDPDLHVKGLQGLRVVDASVFVSIETPN